MAFTKVTADPANIAALADRPKQNNGLSAAQVKAKFDKAGVDLKNIPQRCTYGRTGTDNSR
jgi:alpha-D-ribose 1-methylphosphonate 5-triphosphate diphosphatase PhnM